MGDAYDPWEGRQRRSAETGGNERTGREWVVRVFEGGGSGVWLGRA